MATFPTTQPPDAVEIAEYIRWWLGDVDETTLPQQTMLDIINTQIIRQEDNLCKITYYSTIDILNWLIRKNYSSGGSSGVAGSLTRRRERRGKTEIEEEYSDGGNSISQDWEDILDALSTDPSSIGCDVFGDTTPLSYPVIGGAEVDGYGNADRSRHNFGKSIVRKRYYNERNPNGFRPLF